MTTNKPGANWSLKAMFGKRKTKLLAFTMPTDAIMQLVPMLRQLRIPYELEKQLKENLIVLEVDQNNTDEVFWVSSLCELVRDCYTKCQGFFFIYERRVNVAIQNIRASRL